MIAIKTMIFFITIWITFAFIEDIIEKIILYNKLDGDELHSLYTTGLLSTFNRPLCGLTIIFWTLFYLLNQL